VGTGVGLDVFRPFDDTEGVVDVVLVIVLDLLIGRCDWVLADEMLIVLWTDERSEERDGGGGGARRTAYVV